jgi:hypothetical protein
LNIGELSIKIFLNMLKKKHYEKAKLRVCQSVNGGDNKHPPMKGKNDPEDQRIHTTLP